MSKDDWIDGEDQSEIEEGITDDQRRKLFWGFLFICIILLWERIGIVVLLYYCNENFRFLFENKSTLKGL